MKKLMMTSLLGLCLCSASLANAYIHMGGENEGPRAMVAAGAQSTYQGWIAYNASLHAFIVEIQGRRAGLTGSDWAVLEFTTQDQEDFAQEQYSSETRPLLNIVGEILPGTGNANVHRLDTMKVQKISTAVSTIEAMNIEGFDSGVRGSCLSAPHPTPECCRETGAMIPACGFTGP